MFLDLTYVVSEMNSFKNILKLVRIVIFILICSVLHGHVRKTGNITFDFQKKNDSMNKT